MGKQSFSFWILSVSLTCFLSIVSANGATQMPKVIKVHGNPEAPIQGRFSINMGSGPTTLNPLTSTDAYSRRVHEYVMDSLLRIDPDTYEWLPSLAEKWTVSEDGTVFEFTLREGATWHDGKPVTAEDVVFSYEAIVHPENKYRTAHRRPFFESIKKAEIIGEERRVIRFTTRDVYFGNFDVIAGMFIVPKHIYEDPDEEQQRVLNRTVIGSGPYILKEFDRSRRLILERNMNWWGNEVEFLKGAYRHREVFVRFIQDNVMAIQRLVRGDLDFLGLTPENYVQNTRGDQWGESVFKRRVRNKEPKGYAFIGLNLRNPIFQSQKTRRALSYLVNRELMIDKFLFGLAEPATGPLYRTSIYADPDVEPIPFNIAKAYQLLLEDGWADLNNDQVLQKEIDGTMHRLSFTILEPLQDFMKYLTIFRENARRVGVDIDLRYVEWNTFIRLLDEGRFDAVRLAWSMNSIDWDPKQIWHSDSIDDGGSNFIAYSNPEVDKLIDEARVLMDRDERVKKLRRVYRQIAEDAPYIFFFNTTETFYGHTKKMQFERETLNYEIGTNYWWMSKE